MDITGALSAITASIGLVNEIRKVDIDLDKADLKLKIADLTGSLADAKLALIDVQKDLLDKDREIERLINLLKQRDLTTIEYNGKRYLRGEDGQPKGAPFCIVCEREGLFLQIVQDRSKGAGAINYCCPKCRASYGSHPGVMGR